MVHIIRIFASPGLSEIKAAGEIRKSPSILSHFRLGNAPIRASGAAINVKR
jgi:hypothetical protein